jgi:hypothetical protein
MEYIKIEMKNLENLEKRFQKKFLIEVIEDEDLCGIWTQTAFSLSGQSLRVHMAGFGSQ